MPEKAREFDIFINRPYGFNEARPIGRQKKLWLAMLLHHLREDHQFVVDAFALLSFFLEVSGELQQILTLDIVASEGRPFVFEQ